MKILHETRGFAALHVFVFTGWSLGDSGEWSKFSNFKTATNVPLMVHVPGLTEKMQAQGGMVSDAYVESVDLFATLSDITGLKVPGENELKKQNITFYQLFHILLRSNL